MENVAFAPKEQMLHFPYYFQICDNPKASKGVFMDSSKGLERFTQLIMSNTHILCLSSVVHQVASFNLSTT